MCKAQPTNQSKLISQFARLFNVNKAVVGAGLTLMFLFSGVACTKLDAEDAPLTGRSVELPKTWYLVDAPYYSGSTRLSIPLQHYVNSDVSALHYYVPTLNDRFFDQKMVHKCQLVNKKYAGSLGAFFVLAHNPTPQVINLDSKPHVTVDSIQSPVIHSESNSYSHQFISALKNTQALFQLPNEKNIGFPIVFASLDIDESDLNNLDRSIAYNKFRKVKMQVHNGKKLDSAMQTNGVVTFVGADDDLRMASKILVEEQRTQYGDHKLINYPLYQQSELPVKNKENTVEIVKSQKGMHLANVALQASLYVACRDK